jgi:nucleoside-diphosphate-sugar epimerase
LVPYLISKSAAEHYVRFFADKKQFKYVILRPFETFGPYSPERKIFRKLVQQFDSGNPSFTIYGDPSNLVDPLYVEDTVRALITVILSDKGNVTVDLCTGNPVSIKEVVERIGGVYGIKPKISLLDVKAPVNVHFVSDPKPMEEIFGFKAAISLEDGIRKWQQFKKQNNSKY